MEKITYVVEDRVLAEILGKQNFSTKEAAVLELIKNAYDANSSKIDIIFKKRKNSISLEIIDCGDGMNREIIEQQWMHVGKSFKGYKDEETGRIYAGSKGIGRFALSRLGENVDLYSKRENYNSIYWKTDWETSYIGENTEEVGVGTRIVITNLRDHWTRRSIKPLITYLSKIYKDTIMEINIEFEDEKGQVIPIWENPQIGINYVTSINLFYNSDSQDLNCEIISDEFKQKASAITKIKDITQYKINLNMLDALGDYVEEELMNENEDEDVSVNAKFILLNLGDFSCKFYFSLSSITQQDFDWFEYKHKNLIERYNYGTILYRNAFGIDSFEGRNDWLDLAGRSRRSPAAATHPTGNWHVRTNQISGFILIDKEKNKYIQDLSNRQGITENIYFSIFKKIILEGISAFESYRQSIIKDINAQKKQQQKIKLKQHKDDSAIANKLIDSVKKDPTQVKELTEEQVKNLISEIDRHKQEKEYYKKEKEDIEQKARYDVQLLNVLATSHLKVISLSHEIDNNRNNIAKIPLNIENALKNLGVWNSLKKENLPAYKNVPVMLDDMSSTSRQFINLADTILEETEKSKFETQEYNLYEIVNKIAEKWEKQYAWIKFELDISGNETIIISYDQLMVIFDNLILNSIQQNDEKSELILNIKLENSGECVLFKYRDNGIGLPKKYKSNPLKILEVHESSRLKGHGLGMWIVNNTVTKLDGKIEEINSNNGFSITGYIKLKEKV